MATEEREELERSFIRSAHADDPNVLTCTSTLEMGIDIGDLSSTMLCSIPPNTASYLQRIGRAGRATGTALIVSVVNQRPHDLFFYARPAEMLKGRVDPPGCWLDASAVLVRQYLAYCFDSATKAGELVGAAAEAAKALVEDMANPDGHIPRMMQWVTKNEDRTARPVPAAVPGPHSARYPGAVPWRRRTRICCCNRMHSRGGEYRPDAARPGKRPQAIAGPVEVKLDEEEKDAKQEIEQELHILRGRMSSLDRTSGPGNPDGPRPAAQLRLPGAWRAVLRSHLQQTSRRPERNTSRLRWFDLPAWRSRNWRRPTTSTRTAGGSTSSRSRSATRNSP